MKCSKKFLLDILAKSRWILAYYMAFERSQHPPKLTFNTYLPGMRLLVRAAFQSSEVWCAAFSRLPWENLNFLITIRPSLKSFEDMTVNAHLTHISIIHIYISNDIFGPGGLSKLVRIYLVSSVECRMQNPEDNNKIKASFIPFTTQVCRI